MNLCISRIGIKHIREKFACNSDASNDQPMNIKTINHERPPRCFSRQFTHSIKIDEKAEENFICGWTVFENAEEV